MIWNCGSITSESFDGFRSKCNQVTWKYRAHLDQAIACSMPCRSWIVSKLFIFEALWFLLSVFPVIDINGITALLICW